MSILTKCIGLAKKAKHRYADQLRAHTPVYLSPVRRIERVATKKRICAMTFDDGPCRLPANPDRFGGKPLTLVLAETLERYHARGSFDVVGDTSGNYPDVAGREGSAAWGGVAFDHYPDFKKDSEGGVAHCEELITRLIEGGHEITSHTWKHVLWGKKALVYGKRKYLPGLDAVVEDLQMMDRALREGWDYQISLSRPPHYVDNIAGGFSSYDAYALMGYQYMAASFDGAGWLPLSDYNAEVEATWKPLEAKLREDPDYFCGQIIFQKDGYNMARRSPVADGLEEQLRLLTENGYEIVPVSTLLAHAAFADCPPEDPAAQNARRLLDAGWCPAFRDNTLRPQTVLTRGALAMMAYGWPGAQKRIELIRARKAPFADLPAAHPYSGAAALAVQEGAMEANGQFRPQDSATAADIRKTLAAKTGHKADIAAGPYTHGAFFDLAVSYIK
ncbi:MAG: hypothetical protein DBX52_05550 [Clostridiales bacterium]|nr:MAG: hypothetical protein DBX52_05550 [Clostridiales bacterium]